ncbi:hypothetical protein V1506DRAFT_549829 [Lipomyces tetrasporus]
MRYQTLSSRGIIRAAGGSCCSKPPWHWNVKPPIISILYPHDNLTNILLLRQMITLIFYRASRKVSSAVVRLFAIIVIVTLLVLDAPVSIGALSWKFSYKVPSTVAIGAMGACVTTSGPICAVSALVAVFSGIEGSISGSTGSIEEG